MNWRVDTSPETSSALFGPLRNMNKVHSGRHGVLALACKHGPTAYARRAAINPFSHASREFCVLTLPPIRPQPEPKDSFVN
jgi:hypothetical protein